MREIEADEENLNNEEMKKKVSSKGSDCLNCGEKTIDKNKWLRCENCGSWTCSKCLLASLHINMEYLCPNRC